ncbi:MAG TPA: rod shape-determining protein MreC [Rhizobiales bacterium]|nr:rod shape-determining protein MreC [Hyphomicrobiales bacterium]
MAAALLMLSAFQPAALGGVRAGVSDLFAPVLAMIAKPVQQASDFVRDVSGLAELQAENAHLQQENVRLREWYQAALLLEAENKSLHDLLNVKIEPQHSYVTGRIIADSGNAYVKSLLVVAGRRDGVQKSQAVISGDGLVGRVVEAGQKASRVLLITDMNSRVPILVEGSSQHAILAGTNGAMPVLQHMQQDSDIQDGARIITSGHGGLFPPGLPVGRVMDEGGIKFVKLYADVNKMVHVRIINKSTDPNLRPG